MKKKKLNVANLLILLIGLGFVAVAIYLGVEMMLFYHQFHPLRTEIIVASIPVGILLYSLINSSKEMK